jgi:hypothetical protein
MIDAKKIREAVQALDSKDDSVWEADGSPKLDILKTLTDEPTLTIDDVEEAGIFKRGEKAKPAQAKTKTEANAKDEVDVSTLDPQSPEFAMAVVTKARAEDASLREEIVAHEAELEKHKAAISKLTAARDQQIIIIETYEPKISHAQAVKAIQQQTVNTLRATRERMAVATQVLGPGGTAVTYASRLDAAMASRKRTQEQTANYAKFVHQTAASANG